MQVVVVFVFIPVSCVIFSDWKKMGETELLTTYPQIPRNSLCDDSQCVGCFLKAPVSNVISLIDVAGIVDLF